MNYFKRCHVQEYLNYEHFLQYIIANKIKINLSKIIFFSGMPSCFDKRQSRSMIVLMKNYDTLSKHISIYCIDTLQFTLLLKSIKFPKIYIFGWFQLVSPLNNWFLSFKLPSYWMLYTFNTLSQDHTYMFIYIHHIYLHTIYRFHFI